MLYARLGKKLFPRLPEPALKLSVFFIARVFVLFVGIRVVSWLLGLGALGPGHLSLGEVVPLGTDARAQRASEVKTPCLGPCVERVLSVCLACVEGSVRLFKGVP